MHWSCSLIRIWMRLQKTHAKTTNWLIPTYSMYATDMHTCLRDCIMDILCTKHAQIHHHISNVRNTHAHKYTCNARGDLIDILCMRYAQPHAYQSTRIHSVHSAALLDVLCIRLATPSSKPMTTKVHWDTLSSSFEKRFANTIGMMYTKETGM